MARHSQVDPVVPYVQPEIHAKSESHLHYVNHQRHYKQCKRINEYLGGNVSLKLYAEEQKTR